MKKFRKQFLAVCFLILIGLFANNTFANKLQTLRGNLTYQVIGPPSVACLWAIGIIGTVKSGSGEILGNIKVVGVQKARAGIIDQNQGEYAEFSTCIVNLEAKKIKLNVDVLEVNFDNNFFQGSWVLNKEDFKNAEIHLVTAH